LISLPVLWSKKFEILLKNTLATFNWKQLEIGKGEALPNNSSGTKVQCR
jgi:hypothetical protein